jgi:hypothetical protein
MKKTKILPRWRVFTKDGVPFHIKSMILPILLGIFILFTSCEPADSVKNDPPFVKRFTHTDISTQKDLEGESLEINHLLLDAFNLAIIEDSLLVTAESIYGLDTLLTLYNLQTKKVIKRFGNQGKGPGNYGTISSLKYSPGKKELRVFDMILKRITSYKLTDLLAAKTHVTCTTLELAEFGQLDEVHILEREDTRTIIATNELIGSERLRIVDLNNNQVRNIGDIYTTHELKGEGDFILHQAYKSHLAPNPVANKVVLGTHYTDRIEIYDLDNGERRIFRGPDVFNPTFSTTSNPHAEGFPLFARTTETEFGFIQIQATQEFIFGLYVGKRSPEKMYEGIEDELATSIIVFDWEGNPLAKYNLDQPLVDFSISEEGNKIYGLTYGENPNVYVYKI